MNNISGNIRQHAAQAESGWGASYGIFSNLIESRGLKVGAEIGVAFGGHCESILLVKTVEKLYGVDSYLHADDYDDPMNLPQAEFDELYKFTLDRLSKYGNRYCHLRAKSNEAVVLVDEMLDFLYIDADHSFEGVYRDLSSWFFKVRDGGIIGGHDYGHSCFPGVRRAVDEFFGRFDWIIHCEGEGVWWAEKRLLPISFFIPAFNCEQTIDETVNSIVKENMTLEDEIIICDDGSSDSTPKILREIQNRYPCVNVITHSRNKGGGAARNTAVEQARNNILFCLDSDNVLASRSVTSLKNFLISSGADVAAFQKLFYFKESIENVSHQWEFRESTTLEDYLSGYIVPGASGNYMFTRQSWLKAGGYPEFAGALDTWGFGFRQVATNSKMVALEGSFYFHRYGHDSYWVRDSKRGKTSLIALQIILPFIHLISDKDVDYIMGKNGRYVWFDHLESRPIMLKSGKAGMSGVLIEDNDILMRNRLAGCVTRLWEYFRKKFTGFLGA